MDLWRQVVDGGQGVREVTAAGRKGDPRQSVSQFNRQPRGPDGAERRGAERGANHSEER